MSEERMSIFKQKRVSTYELTRSEDKDVRKRKHEHASCRHRVDQLDISLNFPIANTEHNIHQTTNKTFVGCSFNQVSNQILIKLPV